MVLSVSSRSAILVTSDTEVTPISKVIFDVPDIEVGTLFLADNGFDPSISTPIVPEDGKVTVTREQIESGQFFFGALSGAVGRQAALEFNVNDGEPDSEILVYSL